MLSLGAIDNLERQLKGALVGLIKNKIAHVTLIEAVDAALLWPEPFDSLEPIAPSQDFNDLIARAPLLVCAVAAEIGFRFEGVGTVFWAKFSDALGCAITVPHRHLVAEAFEAQATRYGLSRPSESAFSRHFSVIAWPISNALLPVELVGPISRLMARAPVASLPGGGRSINLSSLRAWATAAEGARLADWLRFEAPATRVLTALLTENRGSVLPQASYKRLLDAVAIDPETFFAARAGRLRARAAKSPTAAGLTLGSLSLSRDATGIRLFVWWPALPPALYEEARAYARSAGWRPKLWGVGSFLHPDTALSCGPFAVALQAAPNDDNPAYPDAAETFGAGTHVATSLARRSINWTGNLLFDVNDERTQGEQRLDVPSGTSGYIWLGIKAGGADLKGLKKLGMAGGYHFFEANLADPANRAILSQDGLWTVQSKALVARHPIDAIGAPPGVVRPDRPFLIYKEGAEIDSATVPQRLPANGRIPSMSGFRGQTGVRAEDAPPTEGSVGVAELILFERNNAFEALIERRLQLRVESRLPLVNVAVSVDLEIGGRLVASGREELPALPMTLPPTSRLLALLYDDALRAKLLETGKGLLRFSIGRSRAIQINLERPSAAVEWIGNSPKLIGANLEATLVEADAHAPHHFAATELIITPSRGAKAYGLRLSDGRIADPICLFTSNIFDYGDFTAHFGEDIGSRRMFDRGKGAADIARARIAWSRARCTTLPAVGAKGRIVRQFEDPLVINLCGRAWWLAEEASKDNPTDPHHALWHHALKSGIAAVPSEADGVQAGIFAQAFVKHARILDPDWPIGNVMPVDGAMDDALNAAFSEAIAFLHAEGALLDVEDDFDFGAPCADWEAAANKALRMIRRPALVRLLAPSSGGRLLSRRSYAGLSVAELAEDLAQWAKNFALPRGQLSAEAAAGALQLWLSPAACDDIDAVVHILINDPFVSRATRYAALRVGATTAGVSQ